MENEKTRFLRVYSNLSMDLRKEIITLLDHMPVTWDVAFQEIEKDTLLGKKILKNLMELEII